jgi:ribosomal protein S18 acetylase RimI-like enzyme
MQRGPSIKIATTADAAAVAELRNAVAAVLTKRHGIGHWSSMSTEKGIRARMKRSSVYIVRQRGGAPVATLELTDRKPWAIDRRYFTPLDRPLYLIGMAVAPGSQRNGIGSRCIRDAVKICKQRPADALCLDAYDAPAGAAGFYRKCGFVEVGRAIYRNTPLIYFELLV